MHNELGAVNVDAAVQLQGRYEAPRIAGDITIQSGTLRVDEILSRALFQPYATEQTRIAEVDAVAALNPWDRLGLDLALHVPATLRLIGDSVQVSQDTPIGLGDINLRVARRSLSLQGSRSSRCRSPDRSIRSPAPTRSRDAASTCCESSSINFRGDLNPEIYVTVTRVISGRRDPRQHLRTAQAAGAAPGQHAAARSSPTSCR